jgi:hypothetical protein
MPEAHNDGKVYGIVPSPADPTELTTKLVDRGIANLRDALEQRMNGVEGKIDLIKEASISNREHVNALSQDRHTLVINQVDHLGILTDTKINAVKELIEKTGELNNTALQAAFAAAKEAVGAAQTASALANTKMEATFTKNFDSVNQLITTIQESLGEKVETLRKVFDDKISDIKDAQTGMEGRNAGSKEVKTGGVANAAMLAAVVVAIVAVIEGILLMSHTGLIK